MRLAPFALLALLGAAPAAAQTAALDSTTALATGRELHGLFFAGSADSLWQRMAPSLREKLGSQTRITETLINFTTQAGDETQLRREWVQPEEDHFVYFRRASYSIAPQDLVVRMPIAADGRMLDMDVQPAGAGASD